MYHHELKQVRPGVWELVQVETKQRREEEEQRVKKKREDHEVEATCVVPDLLGLVKEDQLSVGQRRVARTAASRRLMYDWRELQRSPVPMVTAAPLGDDLFEWHGNLLATSDTEFFGGLVFHFTMRFPDTYPHEPPRMQWMNKMASLMPYDTCLGVLLTGRWAWWHSHVDPYTVWSSSYTVTSILLQLQNAFLDTVQHAYSRYLAEEDIKQFRCACGHHVGNCWPPIEATMIQTELKEWQARPKSSGTPKPSSSTQTTVASSAPPTVSRPKYVPRPSVPLVVSSNYSRPLPTPSTPKQTLVDEADSSFNYLPLEIQLHIFSFLAKVDLKVCSKVDPIFAKLALDTPLWFKRESICFHSKRTDEEDVLGVLVATTLHDPPQVIDLMFDGFINTIDASMELLSWQAFHVEGVRRSVWQKHFHSWLPLHLGPQHGKRALLLFERNLCMLMYGKESGPLSEDSSLAVMTLGKLMNSMIISIVSGGRHTVESAVEGYLSFLHWLLVFVDRNSACQKFINTRIKQFIRNSQHRQPRWIADLGDFIPFLAATDKYQWSDIAESLLSAAFERNQKRAIKKYPILGNLKSPENYDADNARLRLTFDATQESLRMIMCHAFFLNNVARPQGRSISDTLRMLNINYGQPTPRMRQRLQSHIQALLRVDNWNDFFKRLNMTPPNARQLTMWLRQSVRNSAQKKYH